MGGCFFDSWWFGIGRRDKETEEQGGYEIFLGGSRFDDNGQVVFWLVDVSRIAFPGLTGVLFVHDETAYAVQMIIDTGTP